MKKLTWAVVFYVVMMSVPMARAEANAGLTVRNVLSYAFQPVNAVAQLGTDLVRCGTGALWHFITTVASNANRNPLTLNPLLEVH